MKFSNFFFYDSRTRRSIFLLSALIAILIIVLHLLEDRKKLIYISSLETELDSLKLILGDAERDSKNYAVHWDNRDNASNINQAYTPVTASHNATQQNQTKQHVQTEAQDSHQPRQQQYKPQQLQQSATTYIRHEQDNRPKKFTTPTQVDINVADSTLLQRVPGIGAATASKIIAYRTKLGGFHHIDQLEEAIPWADSTQLAQWKSQWLVTGNHDIRKMRINTLTFKELLRHPYLNYEQVKAIFQLRDDLIKIRNWNELKLHPAFSAEDVERLRPYVTFD